MDPMREVRLDDVRESGPVEPGGIRRPQWRHQLWWALVFTAVAIALVGPEALFWMFLIAGVVGTMTVELVRWRRRRATVRGLAAQ
ncbi:MULTISPECIES: hypothetical protein [Micrococcaceae]|nr:MULTISPECIES: hypothetical protein [Micrococcaceae]PCC25597.1 hypothetical protein CIK75_08020 [Glutamicibacter sp. BW78]